MEGINQLGAYIIAVLIVILLPGPNSLYCLSVSARDKNGALQVVLAVLLGDAILIFSTFLGLNTLLATYPSIFKILKFAGAGYLIYLAWNLLQGSRLQWERRRSKTELHLKQAPKENYFRKALILSLLNPKAILFFISFFPQFLNEHTTWFSFLILAGILELISGTYLSFLALNGIYWAKHFHRFPVLSALAMFFVSVLFCYFALNLLFTEI